MAALNCHMQGGNSDYNKQQVRDFDPGKAMELVIRI
jgi:hypothetical protein